MAFFYNFVAFFGTKDIFGSTFTITTSDKKSQTTTNERQRIVRRRLTVVVACGELGMRGNVLRILVDRI